MGNEWIPDSITDRPNPCQQPRISDLKNSIYLSPQESGILLLAAYAPNDRRLLLGGTREGENYTASSQLAYPSSCLFLPSPVPFILLSPPKGKPESSLCFTESIGKHGDPFHLKCNLDISSFIPCIHQMFFFFSNINSPWKEFWCQIFR